MPEAKKQKRFEACYACQQAFLPLGKAFPNLLLPLLLWILTQKGYDGVNDKINEYSQKADEATASTSRLSRIGGMVGKAIGSIATFGKNAAKSLTGAKKSSSGFGLSLGTLVKYGFGIRSLYVLVNKLRSALVDGFKNLSQYSGETNGSISMLWSSLERLKNSLATAFAPILTVVAPILSKFIDMLSTAASYVSMFFSFLSGKSTYTRAIAVQKNYAASLGDTASAAKDAADATEDAAKAAEDYLSPLDDLNKFTAEDTTSKASSGNSGSSGGGVDPGQMFEDVPIESNIEKIFQKIKDLIKSGDFEGLGEMMADAINRGLKKVKKAISWDNVGPTVTYFVTAFTRTFNSLVDNIDWDLLGRTIGISLPHWLEKLTGFSSVGFNVGYWSAPMVPYLAQGAVIPPNKEFMAVLGDQKSGNNIEAPESLIRRIVREESGNGKGSTYNVTAQVNRRTLFDLVLEEGKVRRIIEREREKMDKKKDLIQMLEKIQNPNHLAMVYGFVKRMYLEEQKEREKKHE